eukprot:11797488-Alexandrium_andersonii.AAC.1
MNIMHGAVVLLCQSLCAELVAPCANAIFPQVCKALKDMHISNACNYSGRHCDDWASIVGLCIRNLFSKYREIAKYSQKKQQCYNKACLYE